jgi:hypothetical protein
VLAVLGVLLFAIGLASLAHGHWPGFLPPQLDALEAVASFIAQRLGVLQTSLLGLSLGTALLTVAALLPTLRGEA